MATKTSSFLSSEWSPEVLGVASAIVPGQLISELARNFGASRTLATLAVPAYAVGSGFYHTHQARSQGRKGRAPDHLGFADLGVAAGRGALLSGVMAGANWAGGKRPSVRNLTANAAINSLVSLGSTLSENLAQQQGFNEYLDRMGGHLAPLTKKAAMNSMTSGSKGGGSSSSVSAAASRGPNTMVAPGRRGSGSTRLPGSAQSKGMGQMLQGALTGKNPALETPGVAPISKMAPMPRPPSPNQRQNAQTFKVPKPPTPTGMGMGKQSNWITRLRQGASRANQGVTRAMNRAPQWAAEQLQRVPQAFRGVGNMVDPRLGAMLGGAADNSINFRFLPGMSAPGRVQRTGSRAAARARQRISDEASSYRQQNPGVFNMVSSTLGDRAFGNIVNQVSGELTGFGQRFSNNAVLGPGTFWNRLATDPFGSNGMVSSLFRNVTGSITGGGLLNTLLPRKAFADSMLPRLLHGGGPATINPALSDLAGNIAHGNFSQAAHSPFWGQVASVVPQSFLAKAPSVFTGGLDSLDNFGHLMSDSFSASPSLLATTAVGIGSWGLRNMANMPSRYVYGNRMRGALAQMTDLPEYVMGHTAPTWLRGVTGADRSPLNLIGRTADALQPSITGNIRAFKENMTSWANQNRAPVQDYMRRQAEQFRQQGGMLGRAKAWAVDTGSEIMDRRATGQGRVAEMFGVPAARTRSMYEGLMQGRPLEDVVQEVTNYSPWAWGQRGMLRNLGNKFQNYYTSRGMQLPSGWGQAPTGSTATWGEGIRELHRGWNPQEQFGHLQGKNFFRAALDIWGQGGARKDGFSDAAMGAYKELQDRVTAFPGAKKAASAGYTPQPMPSMAPPDQPPVARGEDFDWKGLAPILGTAAGGVVAFRGARGRTAMQRHLDRFEDLARKSPWGRNPRIQDYLENQKIRRLKAVIMPTLNGASLGSMFGYLPDMLSSAGGELEKLGSAGEEARWTGTGRGTKVGLFFRAPSDLADILPSRGEKDDSPPHVTFIYVGDVDLRRERQFIETVSQVTQSMSPSVLTLGDQGRLGSGEEAAQVVFVSMETALLQARKRLIEALEAAGFSVDKRFPTYRPHITLSYGEAESPVSVGGTFPVSALEIWGLPSRVILPLSGDTSIKTSLARQAHAERMKASYNAANALLHGASRAVTAPLRMFPGLTAAGVLGGTAYGLDKAVARPTRRMAKEMQILEHRNQPAFRNMEVWRRGSNSITPDVASFTPG